MKKPLLSLVLTLTCILVFGQDISLTDGQTVTYDCLGEVTLFDSGGPLGDYANNEDITMTICPPVASGQGIWLELTINDLIAGDGMTLYDGPDDTAPVITQIPQPNVPAFQPGAIFQTTVDNTTGCMTIVFTSNATGTGNFAFDLLCGVKCQPVITNATFTPAETFDTSAMNEYVNICLGDTLNVQPSVLFPLDGQEYDQDASTSTYIWNWGDNTDLDMFTSGQHYYENPGGYIGALAVFDTLGCRNFQDKIFLVRVAPIPEFNTVWDSIICPTDSAQLFGLPEGVFENGFIQGSTEYFVPPFYTGDTTFIPDGTGASWESTAFVTGFDNGDTIRDCGDIFEICMNFEHSYGGDLDIELECPNGQSIALLEFGSGVGSTNFGEPYATATVDQNTSDPTPGVPYEYCFSMFNNNFGTLEDEAGVNSYTYTTVPSANGVTTTYTDTYFPAGTYLPAEDFTGMVGCPINGEWTIRMTDNLGADNGWIFNWSLNIDPCMYPDIDSFTMIYDLGFWDSDPTIVDVPGINEIIVSPDAPGTYNYVYHVSDNFDCEYVNDYDVEVRDVAIAAYGDTAICLEDTVEIGVQAFTINDTITFPVGNDFGIETVCPYDFDMFDTWGDGWNGANIDVIENGVTIDNVGLAVGAAGNQIVEVAVGSTIELFYNAGNFENEVSYTVTDQDGTQLFADGTNPATGLVYTTVVTGSANCYLGTDTALSAIATWSPFGSSIDGPTGPETQLAFPSNSVDYIVEAEFNNGCILYDTVAIDLVTFDYSLTPDTGICDGESLQLNANGSDSYEWTINNATLNNPSIADPIATPLSNTTYYVVLDSAGCKTLDSVLVEVTLPPNPPINNGMNPVSFCEGTSVLLFADNNPNWTYVWTGPEVGSGPTINVSTPGDYVLSVINETFCGNTVDVEVVQADTAILDMTNLQNILCCTDMVTIDVADYVTSGNAAVVSWNNDIQAGPITITSLGMNGEESYDVIIEDANGCLSNASITFETRCIEPSINQVDTVFAGAMQDFNVTQTNHDSSTYNYNWSLDNGSGGTFSDPTSEIGVLTGGQQGIYDVNVDVTGVYTLNNGTTLDDCVESATTSIEVVSIQEPEFPDAFSPNGDGVNEFLIPILDPLSAITEFHVYNRWHQLMYTYSVNDKGWDGTFNGELQPQDVYTYFVRIAKQDGSEIIEQKSVTLLR